MADETETDDRVGPSSAANAGRRPPRFIYDERSSLASRSPGGDYLSDSKLYRRSYVRPIEESEGQPLDSKTAWFLGNNVVFYKLVSNSCVEVLRSKEDIAADGIDGVAFLHTVSGRYTETTDGAFLCLDPGDLGMMQSTIESLARSRRPHMSMLFLPRTRIVKSLDCDLSQPEFTMRKLTTAPLAPFVDAQMRVLFDLYGEISPEDFEAALESTAELLLQLMRGELARVRRPEEQRSLQLNEVLNYIEEHAADRGLTIQAIGRAVGMSRSKLYKLFSEQSLTVAGYLSDIRLRRFVEALRTTDETPISRLAWMSGFDMQPADFSRLFKREYGMTPREARIALQEGRQLTSKSEKAGSSASSAGIGRRSAKP